METVSNFQEFVQCFGEFGTNMVELAQTSGERQNVSVQMDFRIHAMHVKSWLFYVKNCLILTFVTEPFDLEEQSWEAVEFCRYFHLSFELEHSKMI